MAREGLSNLIVALVLTVVSTYLIFASDGAIIWRILATLSGLLLLFTLYFFRDPEREIKQDPNHILSPGDGTIVAIEEVDDPEMGPARKIIFFMSPLNVHINRFPISGTIESVDYRYGSFKAAYAPDASEVNEQNILLIRNDHLAVRFSQIAGVMARRIVSYAREGDEAVQGERYGLIKFGSRMDVTFPRECEVKVGLREPVRGGITVLAEAPSV